VSALGPHSPTFSSVFKRYKLCLPQKQELILRSFAVRSLFLFILSNLIPLKNKKSTKRKWEIEEIIVLEYSTGKTY
jgi:hypothetical protein